MSRRQLTLGDLRKFTSGWPDSTPLVAADSVANPDEPMETQEFILDEGNVPVVALDDGGAQRALRIGRRA